MSSLLICSNSVTIEGFITQFKHERVLNHNQLYLIILFTQFHQQYYI